MFDVGFLRQIPGMTVLCPANFTELREMLRWAVNDCTGPVAVRYPRGNAEIEAADIANVTGMIHSGGEAGGVALISYGTVSKEMLAAADLLRKEGIRCETLRLLSITDFSKEELIKKIQGKHVFVIEEVCAGSGISHEISLILNQSGRACDVHAIDLGNQFVTHGDTASLYRLTGIDHESIANSVREVLRNEN